MRAQEAELANTTVYPNPTGDHLFITSETSITQVSFHDVLGKTILEVEGSSRTISKTNVATLPKGLYFATIISETNQI